MSIIDELLEQRKKRELENPSPVNPFLNGYVAPEQKVWRDAVGNVNVSNLTTGQTERYYDNVWQNRLKDQSKDTFGEDIGQAFSGALQRQGANYKSALATLGLGVAGLLHGDKNYQPEVGSGLWKLAEGAEAGTGAANRMLEDSKYGRGKVGQLVMDLTSGAVDLASDALLTAATGGASIGGKLAITAGLGAMGARSFGGAAEEAREQGKSTGQQFLSGLKSAAIEMLTEKIGGPFEKAYGASALGRTTRGLAERLSKNAGMEFVLKRLGDFAGEASEEILSDVLNPLADKILKLDNGEGWKNLWTADGFSQMAYDGLVGGLLGLAGGVAEGLSPSQRSALVESGIDNAMEASRNGRSIGAELEQDANGTVAQAISNTASQSPAEAQQPSPRQVTPEDAQSAVKPETEEFNAKPAPDVTTPTEFTALDEAIDRGEVEEPTPSEDAFVEGPEAEAEPEPEAKPKGRPIGKKTGRQIAWDAWLGDNVRQDAEPEGVAVDASDFNDEASTASEESGRIEPETKPKSGADILADIRSGKTKTTDESFRNLKQRINTAVQNALAQNGIDYKNDPRSEYYDENTGDYREVDLDSLDEEARVKYLADMRQIRLLDAVDDWLDKYGQKYLSANKSSEDDIQQGLQNALNNYVRRYLDSQTDKASNSEAVEDVMQQRRQDDRLKSLAKEEKQKAPTGYNTVQVGDNLFRVTGPGGITTTEVADNSADAVQKHIDGLTEENRKKAKERKEKEKALNQLRKEVQESQENPTQIEGSDGKLYEVTKELTKGENNYHYVVTELDEDGLPIDMEARIFRKNATNEEEAVQHAIEHPEYFNDGSVEGEDWGERSNDGRNTLDNERTSERGAYYSFSERGGDYYEASRASSNNDRRDSQANDGSSSGALLNGGRRTGEKISLPEAFGDDNSSTEKSLSFVGKESWTSTMTVLAVATKKLCGADVTFVRGEWPSDRPNLKGSISVTSESSGNIVFNLDEFEARKNKIRYTMRRILAHESYHSLCVRDSGLLERSVESLKDAYGEEKVNNAAYKYAKELLGTNAANACRDYFDGYPPKVWMELCADAFGNTWRFDVKISGAHRIVRAEAKKPTSNSSAKSEPGDGVFSFFEPDKPKRSFRPYTPRKGYGYIDVSDESKLSDIDKAVVQDSKSYLEKQEKAIRRYNDGEGVVSGAGFRNMHGDEFEDSILQRKLEEEGAWIENERDGHDWFDIDNAKDWIAEEKLKRLDTVANFRGNINDRNTGYYMMLDVTRSLAKQKLLEAEIAKEEARRKEFGTPKAEEVKAEEPKKVEEAPNPVEPPKLKEPPKAKSGAEILSEAAQKSAKPKPTPKSSTVSQKEQPKAQKPKQEAPKAKPKNESLGLDQQKKGYPEPEEPATPKRSAPPSDLNETLNEMSREREANSKAKDADFEAKRAEDKQQTNAKEYAYNKKLEAEEAGTESSDEEKAKSTFGDGYDKVQKSAEDFGKIKTRFDDEAFKESGKRQDKATRQKLAKLRELFDAAAKTGDVESLFSFYGSLRDDPNLSNFYNEDVQEDIDNFRKLVDENLDTYNEGAAPYAAARTMQKMAHKFAKANEYQQTLKKMNETLRGSKNGLIRKIGKSEKLTASVARALMRWQINPDTVFKMIDAFDKGNMGEGYKLAKELQTAHREKYRVLQQARARFDKASSLDGYEDFIYGKQKVKDYSGREWDMRSALSVVKAIDTIRSTSGKKLGGTDGFGVMDSKGNIEYIDMNDVDAIKLYESLKSGLSDVAIKFGDIANDAFNDVKEPLRKKFKDVNGIDIQMIGDIDEHISENAKKKGIEKAVYSPLSYVDKNGNTYQFDIAKQETYNNVPRFLRERSENGGTYLLIKPYTEVTGKYFEQVSNYLAYSEFNEKMRGLAKGSKYESGLGNTLAEVFGKDMGNWYKSYVEDLASYQNEDDVEGVNSLLRQGRQRLQQGALLFSVSVPMKQISSYWAASGILHPDSLIQAYRIKLLKPKNGSDAATMLASRAMGNLEQSAAEAAKDAEKWLGKLKYSSKFIKMAANAINQMDYNTVSNLLTATEYDVLKYQFNNDTSKIGTEEFNQAVEELFQDVVDRSQPNFDKQMRAEYGRTDNEIVRMLSMFRTQQTQNLNLLATAIGEYQASKGTANQAKATETLKQTIAGQAASAFSLSMLTILADMLLHRQKKYEDEEEELDASKILTRLGINAIEASSGTLWFGDTIAKWAIDRISGGKTKEFYGVNMGVISTVSDILENFENFMRNPSRSNAKYCAGNIATLLGVPLNNAYAMLNSAIMYGKDILGSNEGDYDDILKYLDAQAKAAKKEEEKAAKAAAEEAKKTGADVLAEAASQNELNSQEEQNEYKPSGYLTKPYNALVEAGMSSQRSQEVLSEMDTDGNNSVKQAEMIAYWKAHPEDEEYVIAMWNSYGYKTTWEAAKKKAG